MTYINLPNDQQRAISEVGMNSLLAAVDKCLDEEHMGPIHELGLSQCGPYVTSKLQAFQQAIVGHAKAKAHAKRERTRADALRAGSDLVDAVNQMQRRVETEHEEGLLFFIDDQIIPPFHLSERLTVMIPFHWRPTRTAQWKSGQMTFVYGFSPRRGYTELLPKRKPSAAKSARDLQDRLYEEWERLKMQALFSLREFFRKGGDGDTVPEVFSVRPDAYGGGLNNFSCNFWQSE